MSIQYKMMGKNDNMNPKELKKKGYYPVVVRKQTVDIKGLAEKAARRCNLNNFELEMAINVTLEIIQEELLNSNNVCLEGFGTFSLKAESRDVETPDELRAESIFVKKISFKHSSILLQKMKAATFVKYKNPK
jgi:predicted histone-like DNA-binding protein